MPARSRLDFMLDKTGTLQRASRVADSSGGETRTWAAVGDAVKCCVAPAQAELQNRYAQRSIVVTHQIFTKDDLGARSGDRFAVGGVTYAIKGAMYFSNDAYTWDSVYQLDVERLI